MSDELGSTERPLRVAIVGAGPSGFYTAAALLAAKDRAVSIDLLDRLPAPYGLVRYGVAPDHPKIKEVSRVFERLATDPRVRFLGNVDLGRDVSLADLQRHYDQIVLSVGGQSDRRLGLPGEDLAGSHSSTAFVAWYSAHPDFVDLPVDLGVEAAAVVGIGNVAIDVARILARDPEELAKTDIDDDALAALRQSRIRDVWVLARRGPVQAKCSPAELKELAELSGVDLIVEPEDLVLDPASEQELATDRESQRNLEILRHVAQRGATGAERRIRLRFLVSPAEVLGEDGRVTGLRVERNRLVERDGGLAARGTGEYETLPVGLVVRAVGYRSLPVADVPFDERGGIIPNRQGRVLDPATGEPIPGLYVAGWAKRGPTGLIGNNKPDGAETAARMLEDIASTRPAPDSSREAFDGHCAARGARAVFFSDWQRIDRAEIARGAAAGRPRVKFRRVAEMLGALED